MIEWIIAVVLGLAILLLGYFLGKSLAEREWEERCAEIVEKSLKSSRSVMKGQISEQLSPFLPGFSFRPSECKFIGKPIDFVVFKGMDGGKVEEVILLEVKSGKSGLSAVERSIRNAVREGKVRWEEYRIPEKEV